MKNIDLKCDVFFDIDITEYDKLSHFTFENLTIEAENTSYNKNLVKDLTFVNVQVNDKLIK
jgi:hypothetical protein